MEAHVAGLTSVTALHSGQDIVVKNVRTSTNLELISIVKAFICVPAAVCNPPCAHGGICTAPNTCHCTAQYTGATCQTRKFD